MSFVDDDLLDLVTKLYKENKSLRRKEEERERDENERRLQRLNDKLEDLQKTMGGGDHPHLVTMEVGEDKKKVPWKFDTKEELLAFMHGVSEGFGWISQIRITDITDPEIVDIIDRHGGDIWLVTEEEKAEEAGANTKADPDTNGATAID